MFSMFSHGITAFHGLKWPLRQINQRNPVRVISLTFLFFSKTIRHAWSRCYRRYVCCTKRHETQRNDDFWGRNVTRFSANTERKGQGFLKKRRGGIYIFLTFSPEILKFYFLWCRWHCISVYIGLVYLSIFCVRMKTPLRQYRHI